SGVQLMSASGPVTTAIDASAANPRTRVMQNSANSATTLVQGFTITGGQFTGPSDGSNTTGGGILSTTGDSTTYARNIITNNKGIGPNPVSGSITAGGNVYGGA